MMETRLVTRRADLAALAEPWQELWRRAGRGNPFTHPAWVLAWVERLAGTIQPQVATLHEGQDLVGLAPLGLSRVGPWGRLVPLGWPEADYPDLLIDGDASAGVELLVERLLEESWSWLEMTDLPEASPLRPALEAALGRAGLEMRSQRAMECPRLVIDRPWEEFWGAKKRKFRYNLRRNLRLLGQEVGPVIYESMVDGPEIAAGLGQAMSIHANRWARRHTRTIFSQPRGRAFFQTALTGLAQDGLVRLDLMRAGERLVAFSLSFLSPETWYYYIPGFDPQFAKYSPGTLLLWRLVEQAHRDGARAFDLMKGEEDYKDRWANGSGWTVNLLAVRPGAWHRTGLGLRLGWLGLREWARRNQGARRIYFGFRDPLARWQRRGRG
ncbi:MAG: GNAT family N-acetyltransferase, partial [Deltaproteobacteria bacterium]|nr:GNAT family N-acetyltransferase [Deltaproteobacteria bacterium]